MHVPPHGWRLLGIASLLVAAYTAVVWWLMHPVVKACARAHRGK